MFRRRPSSPTELVQTPLVRIAVERERALRMLRTVPPETLSTAAVLDDHLARLETLELELALELDDEREAAS